MQDWVRFSIHPWQRSDEDLVELRLPVLDRREVRSSNGQIEERYAVALDVTLAGRTITTVMTLSNRDEMGFRLLIGREALERGFLVDAVAVLRRREAAARGAPQELGQVAPRGLAGARAHRTTHKVGPPYRDRSAAHASVSPAADTGIRTERPHPMRLSDPRPAPAGPRRHPRRRPARRLRHVRRQRHASHLVDAARASTGAVVTTDATTVADALADNVAVETGDTSYDEADATTITLSGTSADVRQRRRHGRRTARSPSRPPGPTSSPAS